MVSVGVSQLGCTELFFVDPGTKINGAYYLIFFDRNCCLNVFQGRILSSNRTVHLHIARVKLEVLRRETADFISPDSWPPNSPDLNPVDYEIWAVIQRRVYQRKIHTIDELKQNLIEVWCSLEQSTVDMARACLCEGRTLEHSL